MLSSSTLCAALFSDAMWNCFRSLNPTVIEMFRKRNKATDMIQLELHQKQMLYKIFVVKPLTQ